MTPSEAAVAVEAVRNGPVGASLRLVGGTEVPEAIGEGAVMRDLRLARHLSVVQIAEALILKPDQVAAIEAMDFERLPGLGYALGYVRGYAELVAAPDVEATVDAFRAAWEPAQTRQEKARAVVTHKMAVPAIIVLGAGAVLWLLVWAGMAAVVPRADETITPPDAAIQEWVATQPALPARGAAVVEPRTVLKALRPVRVELRGADGALVLDRMMRAGEEVSTDGLGRWFVTSPDGGALEARGHDIVIPLGENGQKIDWWRVPDLAALAAARSAEVAEDGAPAAGDADAQASAAPAVAPTAPPVPAPPTARGPSALNPAVSGPAGSPADWAVPPGR